jgi:phospholipid/cholesterol/gamma-HCH transport system substrate-binding protein
VTGIAYIQLDDESVGSPPPGTDQEKCPPRIPLRPGLLDQLEKRGLAILEKAEAVTVKLNTLLSDDNQKTILSAFSDVSAAARATRRCRHGSEPTIDKLPALTAKAEQSDGLVQPTVGQCHQNCADQLANSLHGP